MSPRCTTTYNGRQCRIQVRDSDRPETHQHVWEEPIEDSRRPEINRYRCSRQDGLLAYRCLVQSSEPLDQGVMHGGACLFFERRRGPEARGQSTAGQEAVDDKTRRALAYMVDELGGHVTVPDQYQLAAGQELRTSRTMAQLATHFHLDLHVHDLWIPNETDQSLVACRGCKTEWVWCFGPDANAGRSPADGGS